ncbi:MAG: hypothetical protein AAGF11_54635 [Myxococcota bacterium]
MKLVRHVSLRSVKGTATAVFEVDLCEVGPDRFVVNFRHGKHGQRLTDGSKTALAVDRAQADRIFNTLVQQKKRKGYVDVAAGAPSITTRPINVPTTTTATTASGDSTALDARGTRLIGYLLSPGACPPHLPLRRVIWRAGELRLRPAAPILAKMLDKPPRGLRPDRRRGPPWQYAVVWALARCEDPDTIPALQRAADDSALPDYVRTLAAVAVTDLSTGAERRRLDRSLRDGLPVGIARALTLVADAESGPTRGSGDPYRSPGTTATDRRALTSALAEHLGSAAADRHQVLLTLYRLDDPHARRALLDVLRTLPLERPAFAVVRQLFKVAQMRGDGEVFGILAWRFERTRANAYPRWDARAQREHAYGRGTRKWLRRRVWRTLRRLGEAEADEFIDLAMGVLLAFCDEDATTHAFGHYWCFAQLLYHQSPRFGVDHRGLHLWSGRRDRNPAVREEAFPALWDRHPDALVALLQHSRCMPVHEFATTALRANREAWTRVSMTALVAMLGGRYACTLDLAVDIAEPRLEGAEPPRALVLALATGAHDRGRQLAQRVILDDAARWQDDPTFLVALATAHHADTRQVCHRLLSGAPLTPERAQALVARLIAALVGGTMDEAVQRQVGEDLTRLLQGPFALYARTLGLPVIRDLLEHPEVAVQELGANLLLSHDVRPSGLPPDVLAAVMLSAHPSVRTIGVRLFGELPDDTLAERFAVVVDLCVNPHPDVRKAVTPVIARLARRRPPLARDLLDRLVDVLAAPQAAPQAHEGLHADVVSLVRTALGERLPGLTVESVWKLLHAPTTVVQELGGHLLSGHIEPATLELWRIAELASHDVLAVRQAAWAMMRADPRRVRAELDSALMVLDAKWPDSRAFAFELFAGLSAEDFTPRRLVSVCDSVRPDVQQFGRQLATRLLAERDGPEYLLALSQHPSTAMQLFATHYLERFATGHPARIEQMRPYFASVLTAVNRGRVAKQRVLAFLRAQAESAAVAPMVAELLTTLSATIAVEYRAAAIQILNEIRRRHPQISTPLTIRPPRRRGRRAV